MRSNLDLHTLIYLLAEGQLFAPSCHQARLNVSQNVRLWEMAAHHVSTLFTDTHSQVCFLLNKALFWNLCAFSNTSLTVPGERKCASTHPIHHPSFNGMRRKTEKEILCRERWRIKRNDIEKGWCRVERRGEGRGSHGERSCQSLGDFKRTASLWSACSLALCWQLPDCAA